jgi:hypothetical protein
MAGAFPESDDEEDEQEWDQPQPGSQDRDRSISPGRKGERGFMGEMQRPATTTTMEADKSSGRDKGPDSDAEWGVD